MINKLNDPDSYNGDAISETEWAQEDEDLFDCEDEEWVGDD